MRAGRTAFALIGLAVITAAGPRQATAQIGPPPADTRFDNRATVLAANILIGGLTAGVASAVRGDDILDALWKGGAGGVVTYMGKEIAAGPMPVGGLLGRTIAAAGTSMTRNAAAGRSLHTRMLIPVGPIRVYLDWEANTARVKVDAAAAGLTLYALAQSGWTYDAKVSITSGAPVFRWQSTGASPRDPPLLLGHERAVAAVVGGVMFFRDDVASRDVVAHERVHVLQVDQLFTIWSDPLEDAVIQRLPGGPGLVRWVDLNLGQVLLVPVARFYPEWETRPWEREARILSGQSHGDFNR